MSERGKYVRIKKVYTVGITCSSGTLIREGEDARGMIVYHTFAVLGNPQKSADIRAWLDAVRSGLAKEA